MWCSRGEGDDVTAAESEAAEVAGGPARAQAVLLVGWLVGGFI